MRALRDDYRLIVPDLPGFGESWVHAGAAPGLELQAAALRAVLDAEGVERTHAVGTSYGGSVVLVLATESPDRVGRIALVGSPGHTYTRADHAAMLARLDVSGADELFLPPEPADLRTLLGAATRLPAKLVPRFLLVDLYEDLVMTHEETKAALVADLESRDGLPPPPVTGEDVLVVWGPRDGLFPVEVGERLAGDLDARFVVLRRASHRPHAERSVRFNRLLREFLAEGEVVARR
jgi:pimeloyl-ACP methyl ester carboxylesterase